SLESPPYFHEITVFDSIKESRSSHLDRYTQPVVVSARSVTRNHVQFTPPSSSASVSVSNSTISAYYYYRVLPMHLQNAAVATRTTEYKSNDLLHESAMTNLSAKFPCKKRTHIGPFTISIIMD